MPRRPLDHACRHTTPQQHRIRVKAGAPPTEAEHKHVNRTNLASVPDNRGTSEPKSEPSHRRRPSRHHRSLLYTQIRLYRGCAGRWRRRRRQTGPNARLPAKPHRLLTAAQREAAIPPTLTKNEAYYGTQKGGENRGSSKRIMGRLGPRRFRRAVGHHPPSGRLLPVGGQMPRARRWPGRVRARYHGAGGALLACPDGAG